MSLFLISGCATQRPSPQPIDGPSIPLLILFDQARFGRDDRALDGLWRRLALKGPPMRGLEATHRVLEGLAQMKPEDPDTRSLLAADRALLNPSADLAAPARELRRLWRSQGRLAPSAALRLHALCFEALREAARLAGTRAKIEQVNRCLFAVVDTDPAPYFHTNPHLRPPDPSWTTLAEHAQALLYDTSPSHALHAVAHARSSEFAQWIATAAPHLPAAIDASALGLPVVPGGQPYDRQPLLQVTREALQIDGVPLGLDAERQLALVLDEETEKRVAVCAPTSLPWSEMIDALRMLRRAGMLRAELAATEPRAGRLAITLFAISLAPLLVAHPSATPRNAPRGLWLSGDEHAQEALHLVVGQQALTLRARDGLLSGDPFLQLRQRKERGVVVTADADVAYGRVVSVIAQALTVVPAVAVQ